jgi:hypothetical protein
LGLVPANGLVGSTVFPAGVLAPGSYQVVGTDVNMWFLAFEKQAEEELTSNAILALGEGSSPARACFGGIAGRLSINEAPGGERLWTTT